MKASRWHEFMTRPSDHGLTFLLLALFVLLFVVQPFFRTGAFGQFAIETLLSLVVFLAATAVPRPRLRQAAFGLAAVTIVTRWLTYVWENTELITFHATLEILFLWLAIYGLVIRVFSRGRITYRQIAGAVAVYLLIGLVFAEMYFLLEWGEPGSFQLVAGAARQAGSVAADFNYFSLVTLTTVGYGDITPLSDGARSLTVLESLIGQLFPAVLLARLVSMEIGASANDGS